MDPMGVSLQVFEERRAAECPWEMNSPGAVVGESCWWLVGWVIDCFFLLWRSIYLPMNIILILFAELCLWSIITQSIFLGNDTSVTHCFLYTVSWCIITLYKRNVPLDIPHPSLLPGHHGHWRTFSRSIREAQTCTSEVSAGSVPFFLGVGENGWWMNK